MRKKSTGWKSELQGKNPQTNDIDPLAILQIRLVGVSLVFAIRPRHSP